MVLNGTRQELAARRMVALRPYRPGRDVDRARRGRRLTAGGRGPTARSAGEGAVPEEC